MPIQPPVIHWPQDTDLALSLRIGAASAAMAGAVLTWRLSDSPGGADTGAAIAPTAVTLGEATEGNGYEVGQIYLSSGCGVPQGGYWLSWRTSYGDGGIPAAWAGSIRVNVTASGPRSIDAPAIQPDTEIWTLQPINLVTDGEPVISIGGQTTVIYSGGVPTVAHADTTGRDAVDSHPIGSITGLDSALAAKVATNDARLSDARTPTAHAATHATGGADAIAGLHSHDNAATLAKIGEADGLPLWDGGAWPGGGDGGGITAIESLDTAAPGPSSVALDAAQYGGGTLTLAAGAEPTITLSGATAGQLTQYVLTITNQGVSYPVWPGVYWSVGHQPDFTAAGTWEIVLRTTDGGAVISGAAYYRTIVGSRRVWFSEFDDFNNTLLSNIVPRPGAAPENIPAGGLFVAGTTAPLVVDGGAWFAYATTAVIGQYTGSTIALPSADYTMIARDVSATQSARDAAIILRYVDQSNFVAITRPTLARVRLLQITGGVATQLGEIVTASTGSIDLETTCAGETITVRVPSLPAFGEIVANGVTQGASSTIAGIGIRFAGTSGVVALRYFGSIEVLSQ